MLWYTLFGSFSGCSECTEMWEKQNGNSCTSHQSERDWSTPAVQREDLERSTVQMVQIAYAG